MSARRVVTTARSGSVDVVVEEFREFLARERGLARETVRCYGNHAEAFLAALAGPLSESLGALTAREVTAYVVAYSQGRNTWSAKAMVTALRSFLRFGHVRGRIPAPLVGAVPAVAGWRGASLPRVLAAEQVEALIAACEVGTDVGRRDRAVLLMLARLGLRACEVAALELADVDWRAGRVLVHGKGARVDVLPLPAVVGQALVAYLRGDAEREGCRFVFLTVRGHPRRGLTPAAVRGVVVRACAHAGLPRLSAHRLRHTLASDLLRSGATLAQVGQVLRHRAEASTAIYAKVDETALRQLARPWPVGAP